MHCANHPKVETDLTCGRCEKPICTRCMVHMEVGIRCRECHPKPKEHHLRLGALLGLGAIGFLVAVVVVPQVLGLKPDVRSSDLPKTPALPAAAVMPASPPLPPTPSYDLLLVSASCTLDSSVHSTVCAGSVKNSSGHNLAHVQVVVTMATQDETPQASANGPIDYDPLLPDQESPWTLTAGFNPDLTKYRISFRTADGQPLRAQKETP
jgi:hypothetical protein